MSAQGIDIDVHVSQVSVGSSVVTRLTSRLTLIGLSEMNDVGDYWCQVMLENGATSQKKSTSVFIGTAMQYQEFEGCVTGMAEAREQVSCLRITAPGVTESLDASTSLGQESQTQFDPEPSLTSQNTGSDTEESDNSISDGNLVILYAIVSIIVFSLLLILLLTTVVTAIVRHKQKIIKGRGDNSDPELKAKHQSYQLENLPANRNFDITDNLAYREVNNTVGNKNSTSFVTAVSPRSATSPVYEEILN